MRLVAIMIILSVLVFIVGCASEEISTPTTEKTTTTTKATTTPSKTTTTTKTTTSASTQSTSAEEEGTQPEERVTVTDTTGDTTTFKKLPEYNRDKVEAETCGLSYPLKCVKFFAKDGIVYITLKNDGYTSKIDEVTLKYNDDTCDPQDTYIETGQVKEFECFEDPKAAYATGTIDISYYSPIEQKSFTKTGKFNVMME